MSLYNASVTVSLINRVTPGLLLIGRQLGATSASAAALQRHLDGIKTSLLAGGALIGVSAGIAAGFLKAANAAGSLEMKLQAVQIAGKFTTSQMGDLRKSVFDISNELASSASQVAGYMQTIATGAGMQFSPQQTVALTKVIGQLADVMLLKGVPQEETAAMGVRFAHLFQRYSPEALKQGFDYFYRAAFTVPGGPQQLMSALQYVAPIMTPLHVPIQQQLAFSAALNRMGFTSRAGTALANMMLYSISGTTMLTGSRQRAHEEALARLGLVHVQNGRLVPSFMQNGQANLIQLSTQLAAAEKDLVQKLGPTAGESAYVSLTQEALNMRGMRGALALATQPAQQMIASIIQSLTNMPSLDEAFNQVTRQWTFQWRRLVTNLVNIPLKVLDPFLAPQADGKGATAVDRLKGVADALSRISDAITPSVARTILTVAGAFTAVTAMAGSLLLANAAIAAFALVFAPAGAVVAAVAGLTLIALNWNTITKTISGATSLWVERMRISFHNLVIHLQQLVHDVTFGLVPGPAQAPNPTPGGGAPPPPGANVPPGFEAIANLAGGIAGYRRIGPHGLPAGPLMTLPQVQQWTVTHHKGQATGGFVNHGPITINVHAQTSDPKRLAQQIIGALDEMARDHYRASGAGILHPLIPSLPTLAYG